MGESVVVKNCVAAAAAFDNITRLVLGKRFVNSEGVMEKQGVEFKAIVANGLRLGASLTMAELVPWLRWRQSPNTVHVGTNSPRPSWKSIHLHAKGPARSNILWMHFSP